MNTNLQGPLWNANQQPWKEPWLWVQMWCLIDLLLLPISCQFYQWKTSLYISFTARDFVLCQVCTVLNCSHDTMQRDKKRIKSHCSVEPFPSIIHWWRRVKPENLWRTIGLCHPKKAGPFKIITLFLTRESGLLCHPWPHPSPFSWQPQHGNLVKCGAEIVLPP